MANILSSFANWVRKTKIRTKRLFTGMKNSWGLYEAPEIALMNKVREVKEETRDGLYGSSVIGSKAIALNPKTLGQDPVMWATSALHEAEHGVNKAETEEAPTRREFMFLGKLYKRGVNTKRKALAQAALKGAVIAMRQRKRMVEAKDRGDDVLLLKRLGFSDRAASFIAGV